MKRRVIWKLLASSMLSLFAMAGTPVVLAQAAPATHILDPVLSLTGGCTTSVDDSVPDPDCPYPPPPGGPSESFVKPSGIAIDQYGNVYVAVKGPKEEGEQTKAHIDIFDPQGSFITELSVPMEPHSLAVDSKGYLYVYFASSELQRYDPVTYNPVGGEIAYEAAPDLVDKEGSDYASLAINPENDHLFVHFGNSASEFGEKVREAIVEYGSGEEGNPLLDDEVAEAREAGFRPGLAIDQVRGRLYATDLGPDSGPNIGLRLIRVFELAPPHNLIETIDGSSLPEGAFVKCGTPIESCLRQILLAVDEATGNLFVYTQEKTKIIYELSEDGQYLSTIEHNLAPAASQVAVDNGEQSPNGALNPEGRYLWATSSPPGIGHAYAFKPTEVTPPAVESVTFSDVSEDEALLEATIDPGQAETTYVFEYVSLQQFEATEFVGAGIAGQGTIAAGTLPVAVSAQATGLSPGTKYVFRVTAENEVSPPRGEGEGEFRTYPAIVLPPCPNAAARIGPSAALPDCRAYELVTPPDTAGRPPLGLGVGLGLTFPALPASPAGDRVFFRIENGLIPGLDATASLAGDPYLSTRGPDGWDTVTTGGDGTEATAVAPGGRSPDQTFSAWAAEGLGPAVIGGERTVYVRYPDGHSELFGKGSLTVDPHVEPMLISEGGGHMVFISSLQLENEAQPAGKPAVYDRTADGVTHVASLLPGDLTPSESQTVFYRGASLDGRGIAFDVIEAGVTKLYLRYNDETTYEVGEGLTFEGVAEGGKRVFYLDAGSLYALDVDDGVIPFVESGDVTVVNVSADGSTAYFVSPSELPSIPNPLGADPVAGKQNLYQSHEGSISYVGTVSDKDVEGEGANVRHNGLGLWARAVHGEGNNNPGGFAIDPSRTTDDGDVLLFQADADLTPYESGGSRQIYRYDSATGELACISCNPTGAPPSGDALLQDVPQEGTDPEPNGPYDVVENLSAGGRRVFFQSHDPLVAADTDGLQDVYEWEAQGVGSCTTPGGCLYLISSGRSEKVNYLYAASESGDDVFFRTSDLLAPADKEAIPSIYDARVGGGFPKLPLSGECEGEGCRPQLTQPPALSMPGPLPTRSENVRPKCPKGKHKVRRHGKVRCIKKKHRRHHRQHRAAMTKEGARK